MRKHVNFSGRFVARKLAILNLGGGRKHVFDEEVGISAIFSGRFERYFLADLCADFSRNLISKFLHCPNIFGLWSEYFQCENMSIFLADL